jgi:hypothetical protein
MLRTSSLAAVLAVVAVAPDAGAQPLLIKGLFCREPTLAQCKDAAFVASSCGQARCGPLLEAEYRSQYAAAGTAYDTTVFSPLALDGAEVQPGKKIPFDPLGFTFKPIMGDTLASFFPPPSRPTSGPSGVPVYINPVTYIRHPAFEKNGNRMDSCAEYVYEKYYDYSRFDDAAKMCGNDFDCVYRVAFHSEQFQVGQNVKSTMPVPVTPAIARKVLRRRDGAKMKVELPLMPYTDLATGSTWDTIPKNAYFAIPASVLEKATNAKKSPLKEIILRLKQGDRTYRIGTTQYPDEWTWHEAMQSGQSPLGITPGERISIDRRLARVRKLLDEYWMGIFQDEASVVPIFDAFTSPVPLRGGTVFTRQDPFFYLGSIEHVQKIVTPTVLTAAASLRSTSFEAELTGPGSLARAGGLGGLKAAFPTPGPAPVMQTMSGTSTETVFNGGGGVLIKPGVQIPGFDKLGSIVGPATNSIADRIAFELEREWNRPGHGCLGADNRCDWSPRMFAERFVDLFQYERQADLDRCLAVTAAKFDAADPTAPSDADRASVEALEAYFLARKKELAAQLEDVPVLASAPGTDELRVIGNEWGDKNELGFPDILGARYDWHAHWKIRGRRGPAGQLCRLDADAEAKARAEVTYPDVTTLSIKDKVLVDTLSYVRVDNTGTTSLHSHFVVLDQDLYTPIDPPPLAPGELYAIPESTKNVPILDLQKTVIIMGVPVTGVLKVNAEGRFGGAVRSVAAPPGACDPQNLAVRLEGDFLPELEARAKAYLMVGVPGLSAGVSGDLQVLQVGVPINAALWLAQPAPGQPVNLNFKAKAALDMHALAGRIEAYAEACAGPLGCARTSRELIAWDGLHYSYPLIDLTKSIELRALGALTADAPIR